MERLLGPLAHELDVHESGCSWCTNLSPTEPLTWRPLGADLVILRELLGR